MAKACVFQDADRESLKKETSSLLEYACNEGWDGENSVALEADTVDVARQLIDRFPSYVTRPDVAATPHGEVDFDWIIDRDVMLTVSISPSKEVVFSGLFYDARLNGREPWTGEIPKFVNCCFERLQEARNE